MVAIDGEIHAELGAEFGAHAGGTFPAAYGDQAAEYGALRRGAGILDRSHRALLEISGADRETFVQRLLSNDFESLAAGTGREAMLLTPKGMLISHMNVLQLGESYLIDLPGSTCETVRKKLEMYVLSAPVEVADRTPGRSLIGVHGPEAERILAGLGATGAPADLLGSSRVEIAGAEALLVRVDYLGLPGFDLWHVPASTRDLLFALVDAGARPVGFRAAEAVRIESGVAAFGAEVTEGLLPPEVPALAERAISYEKGCYVGQETISRLNTYGHVNRELRGLVLGGNRVPEPGAAVSRSGRDVGVVTSACAVPGRESPIALAFVRRKHNEPGTRVEVEMSGGVALATVVPPGGPWKG